MFFILSKLLWMMTAPVTIMVALVLAGIALLAFAPARWASLGRRLAAMGALLLLACGILPVGTLLLRPLEDRFPPVPVDLPPPTGIVVLGGSTDQAISVARNRVAITDAAERLTEAVILSRRYPEARLVFTGGSATVSVTGLTEADDARRLWIALGVDPARITTENRSRNTDENARFVTALVRPQPDQRWLLVTSGYHMPRAVGLFRANGFPVIPYPVDYRTTGTAADFLPNPDVAGGLARFNMAVREWIGLIAYAATGKIASFFPGP